MNLTGPFIHIPKPEIFSCSQCLHFLDRNYDDCLYTVKGDQVLKPLLIDGQRSLFGITDAGDTGLQSVVSDILGLNRKPNREVVEALFEPFAGWESYLNMYLWRTLI